MDVTKRYISLSKRKVNRDPITEPWPEIGLVLENAPEDPLPSIRVKDGVIIEMDGKRREDFDLIDRFIADYGIDKSGCERAMALPSADIAKRLVDVNVTRDEIVGLTVGLTPAKLMRVVCELNIVEIMMAQMKMRARRSIGNQAHVTNLKDNPVLMSMDAAEAALRGFTELETTGVVGRIAPLNAIALLVGGQAGRPGVLTQCSMEEAYELQLGIQGLTTFAETLSVYGTEGVFTDGDDTPWSKAFLSAGYLSRGIKTRFSSGTGSEVMMGAAEGKSMLYLEARCLWIIKASGIQGTQNGSLDGIAITSTLPGGLKTVASENLIASMLGLEVASGNDTYFTESDMRRTAKFVPTLFAGTDLITSGYSATPNSDNVFAGSNVDTEHYDDWYMIQRDFSVDGGIVPVKEEDVVRVRRRAGKAMQALFEELHFAPIGDEEIEAAVFAYSGEDIIDRNIRNDIRCAELVLTEGITGLDIACALNRRGFAFEGESILALLKHRVAADYLQTSAFVDSNLNVKSIINDRNDYRGPGTAYRPDEERIKKLNDNARLKTFRNILEDANACGPDGEDIDIREIGDAERGKRKDEVVIAVSPSFGSHQKKTLGDIPHLRVLDEVIAGIEEEGLRARCVKCYESSDLGVIASIGAKLSGSGIGVGIQSKGTSEIQQKDFSPLFNLELFSQAPLLDREAYRKIGGSAARYAKGETPEPLPARIDPSVHPLLIKSSVLHYFDTQRIVRRKKPVEFTYVEKGAKE